MFILNFCHIEFLLSFILQCPLVIYLFTLYYSSEENVFFYVCLKLASPSIYIRNIIKYCCWMGTGAMKKENSLIVSKIT